MLRLNLLGRVAIERDGVPATVPVQRRVLAVLASLARGDPSGVSRDAIVARLWSESDEEHGRNALRQTLYRLRRELGVADAVVGTTQLRLNPAVISADVVDFDSALEAGDHRRAAALYRGPFLDGVHIRGAPEFERWVSVQRLTLASRAAAVLELLAEEAGRSGDHAAAVSHWRRLVDSDPLRAKAALGLVRALRADGDATGALQHARLYERIARQEFGIEPDAAVMGLARSGAVAAGAAGHGSVGEPGGTPAERPGTHATPPTDALAGVAAGPNHGGTPPSPAEACAVRDEGSTGEVASGAPIPSEAVDTAAKAAAPPARAAPVWRSPGARKWVHLAWVPAIVAMVLLGLPRLLRPVAAGSPEEPSADRVAVFAFEVDESAPGTGSRSSSGIDRLGPAVSGLLATALDGAGPLRAVQILPVRTESRRRSAARADVASAGAEAARVGARRFVLGQVMVTGERLRLSAGIYDVGPGGRRARTERIAEAAIDCDPASLATAVDRLAIRLIGSAHAESDGRFARTAALGTSSVSAYKDFIAGEAHFRTGRYGPAVDAYQRAVHDDSAFAIAYYRLAVAADWASRQELFDTAVARAGRLAARLTTHDRSRLHALIAWHSGDARRAEVLYRAIVTQHPDDAEAWYQLGETQMHLASAYGGRAADARRAFERALALQPGNREAMAHLQRLAAKARDRPRADSLTRALANDRSDWESTLWVVLRAFAFGDTTAQARALELLRAAADETVLHAAIRTAVYAEDVAGARRVAALLTEGPRGRSYATTGSVYHALLETALGRPARASGALRALELETGVPTIGLRAALLTLPVAPAARAELLAARDSVRRWRHAARPEADSLAPDGMLLGTEARPWVLGLLSVRLGDTREAERQARALERMGGEPPERALAHDLAQVLRAEVARRAGDPGRALALASTETAPLPGAGALQSLTGSRAHQRYLRAELLAQLGREEEALRWFDAIGDLSLPELVYAAPAELRQAELHERRGDLRRATAHYRRFVELWRECEPALRPVVADVERRLGRLAAQ